jgi:lysyl-tRNA synthetase class 2
LLSYRELFLRNLELDPLTADSQTLRRAAEDIPSARGMDLSRDGWLDLLLTHRIENRLGRGCLTFVYDYPPSQAALARIRPDTEPVAERFELYLEGVELANGFQELTDAAEQRRRFESDLAVRKREGIGLPALDDAFLAALEAGLPECSGVALGLDRLLMAVVGASHIDEVLSFPVERA